MQSFMLSQKLYFVNCAVVETTIQTDRLHGESEVRTFTVTQDGALD